MGVVRIDLLGEHPDLVTVVSRWNWDEWGGAYSGDTYENWATRLASKTNIGRAPCSWIAFDDEAPVGSVVLELDGVEPRPELTPDLAGLFVLPHYRGRGICSALVRACEDGARAFGIDELFLDTSTAATLYERLGWRVIERANFQGEPSVIMAKRL